MPFSSAYTISIVFPAYNEEENVPKAIAQAVEFADNVFADWEVIVVNDGSADKTGAIISKIAAQNPKVKALHHETNKGYGRALTTGFNAATKDLIFFCDSDLQFHITEMLLFLTWINTYDIVIGYRSNRQDPFHRKINAFGWKVLVRAILGLKVKDIDCAFKLFRREVFDYIKIDAIGAMVNTDILVQSFSLGFKVKELPVTHFSRVHGTQTGANLRVILKAFKELWRLSGKLKKIEPVLKEFDWRTLDNQARCPERRKQNLPTHFQDRRRRMLVLPDQNSVERQAVCPFIPATVRRSAAKSKVEEIASLSPAALGAEGEGS